MSANIGYFFNSDLPLPELGTVLDQVLGCHFTPYEGDESDLYCRLMSLETSLCEHQFENDRDLNFTAFRYQFDTRTPWGEAELREIQLGFMAMLPSILHLRAGILGGMLVYDGERLVARYEIRDNKFFDSLSNLPVTFPAHFHHVCARLQIN